PCSPTVCLYTLHDGLPIGQALEGPPGLRLALCASIRARFGGPLLFQALILPAALRRPPAPADGPTRSRQPLAPSAKAPRMRTHEDRKSTRLNSSHVKTSYA